MATPALTLVPGAVTPVAIYGQSTGAIGSTAVSDGVPPFAYSWSDDAGVSADYREGLIAGTYTLTVKDSQLAEGTFTFEVTQSPQLVLEPGAVTDVAIFGQSTGAIEASAISGGVPDYVVTWGDDPTLHTLSRSSLPSTSFTLTVTDSAGATASHTFVIGTSPRLIVTPGAITPVAIYGQSTGAIADCGVSGGVPGYRYDWADSSAAHTPGRTGLPAGVFTLTVTDSVGATASTSVEVTGASALYLIPGAVTPVSIYGQATGQISETFVAGGRSPFAFRWSDSSSISTATRAGLAAGQYVLTVTDSAGATASQTYAVGENPPMAVLNRGAVTSVLIYGQSTGAIGITTFTGGAGGSYSYAWSDTPSVTIAQRSSVSAGTYVLTATDSAGASAQASFTVSQNPQLVVTPGEAYNAPVYGQATGRITQSSVSGGVPPYDLSWSDGPSSSASRAGLRAGEYTLYVTDAVGASATRAFVVGENGPIVIGAPGAVTKAAFGRSNGAVSAPAGVSGGNSDYVYYWSDSPKLGTPGRTGLPAGRYSLKIGDTAGAARVEYIYTVEQYEPICLVQRGVVTPASHAGSSDASISQTLVAGGNADYRFSWNRNPALYTTSAVTGIRAGQFALTVTDTAGSAKLVVPYSVEEYGALEMVAPGPTACAMENGEGYIGAPVMKGGDLNYVFAWSDTPSVTTPYRRGLAAGEYTLSVEDCTSAANPRVSHTYTIRDYDPLALTPGAIKAYGTGHMVVSCSVEGGKAPFSFEWADLPGQTFATGFRLDLSGPAYTLRVTDSSGQEGTVAYTMPKVKKFRTKR